MSFSSPVEARKPRDNVGRRFRLPVVGYSVRALARESNGQPCWLRQWWPRHWPDGFPLLLAFLSRSWTFSQLLLLYLSFRKNRRYVRSTGRLCKCVRLAVAPLEEVYASAGDGGGPGRWPPRRNTQRACCRCTHVRACLRIHVNQLLRVLGCFRNRKSSRGGTIRAGTVVLICGCGAVFGLALFFCPPYLLFFVVGSNVVRCWKFLRVHQRDS